MKSNKAYWYDRQVEIFLLSERNALKLHADLKSSYQKAADSLNDELAKLYARYGKGQIQQHQLFQQLSSKELGDWRMKIEEYIALIRKLEESDSAEAKALLLELNALSLRSRLTRLEAMQGQVTAQLAYLTAIEESEVHKHLKSEYTNTYYRLMYEGYKEKNPRVLALMQQHKVKVDPTAIAHSLSLPWSGANYSTRIWRRQYQVANKVKELMAQHLLTGASVQRLTKMVTDELGKDYKYAAERLIRTETAFVHGQADLKMYEDLGIEQYEFIATLDNKTSEVCRELDLKVFKLSEAVVGKNYPPMHPNCRSTTGMYDPEWEGTRLAKGEDGEYYKVPGDMNYEQWYNYVNNPSGKSPFGKAAGESIKGVKVGEPTNLGTVDFEDKEMVHKTLLHFEEQFKDSSIEHNISITTDGDVWYVRGTQGQVNPTKIIEQGISLEGSYSFHNHPAGESHYSFSREDIEFFLTHKEGLARASDEKYWYEMRRRADTVILDLEGIGVDYAKARIEAIDNIRRNTLDIDLDEYHETAKILSELFKFDYERGLK